MFTIAQIKEAHSNVKSGADFPAYIQAIKQMGVTCYETYVADGHASYFGANDYQTSSPAKYESLSVADTCDAPRFKADLIAHQQGQSDYLTFCRQAAASGINKWSVRMDQLTCTYYDKAGQEILVETIPSV
nr:DUF1398 family protein [uncultured Arsenicibacter sp.]